MGCITSSESGPVSATVSPQPQKQAFADITVSPQPQKQPIAIVVKSVPLSINQDSNPPSAILSQGIKIVLMCYLIIVLTIYFGYLSFRWHCR